MFRGKCKTLIDFEIFLAQQFVGFSPFLLILQESRNKIHQAVTINSDALSCITGKLQKFIKLNCKIHKGQQVTSGYGRNSNRCASVLTHTQVSVSIRDSLRTLYVVSFSQTCLYIALELHLHILEANETFPLHKCHSWATLKHRHTTCTIPGLTFPPKTS